MTDCEKIGLVENAFFGEGIAKHDKPKRAGRGQRADCRVVHNILLREVSALPTIAEAGAATSRLGGGLA